VGERSLHTREVAGSKPAAPIVLPFTLRNLEADLEDLGSNFDGSPDLEFRHASEALGLEHCGLSYQRIPPDYRFPYGHTHNWWAGWR
jgi:hypothetical protein